MAKEIPKTLYRGVVIQYENLKGFRFHGIDLVPYGEPIIDENGRKLIGDGNEFGIYMTDNQSMVYSAYGNVHGIGTPLSRDIRIGRYSDFIAIPDVGICYEINTEGVDVREPWISDVLMGHYNNGFEGSEYITDRIPSQNITVTHIQIGEDYLHEEEFIDVTDIQKAEEVTKKKLEDRKKRLEDFLKLATTLDPQKRRYLGEREKHLFRDIYGENGVKYKEENSIDLFHAAGILTQLLFTHYHNSPDNLDFQTLLYIEQLKERLAKSKAPDKIDTLLEMIQTDISANLEKKDAFVERKKVEGAPANTAMFEQKNLLFTNLFNQIATIQKKKEQIATTKLQQMHIDVIKKVEQMLQIKITPTIYLVDPNTYGGTPQLYYKTVPELVQERGQIFQQIDALYINGSLDLGTSNMMKRVIMEEYVKLEQAALEKEHTQTNQDTSSPKSK